MFVGVKSVGVKRRAQINDMHMYDNVWVCIYKKVWFGGGDIGLGVEVKRGYREGKGRVQFN